MGIGLSDNNSLIILYSGSLNLTTIVQHQEHIWYCIPLMPLCVIMFISLLAETNRAPFDLPEAEAELVAGYNVEYTSMGFALFFLGEYANIILMCIFIIILFFGGWMNKARFIGGRYPSSWRTFWWFQTPEA